MIGLNIGLLFGSGASGLGASTALPPQAAMRMAESQKERQIDRLERDPVLKRQWAAFEQSVKTAKSPEDLLNNRNARAVLLGAYGLGDQVDRTALVKKTLMSDPYEETSLSFRLTYTNPNWGRLTKDVDLYSGTLSKVRLQSTLEDLKERFFEARWRADVDAQNPGLGAALLFKERAATFTNVFEILGDKVAREVVTRALNLPPQLAIQSVETQGRAIEARLKIADLKKPEFVDRFIQRYLIQVQAQGANPGIVA